MTQVNAEFLSKRLARVAKLAGVIMPSYMTHEQIAEVAGTILADIARSLEFAQRAGSALPAEGNESQSAPVSTPKSDDGVDEKAAAANAAGLPVYLAKFPEGDSYAVVTKEQFEMASRMGYDVSTSTQQTRDANAGGLSADDREARELARADQSPVRVTNAELAAFHRFCECAEDFESGGHDVPKAMMSQLVRVGLLRPAGPGRHQTTKFGDWMRDCDDRTPAADAGGLDASKAIYWFGCLEKCARLLGLPDDEPIPSGVVAAVERLIADRAPATGAGEVVFRNDGQEPDWEAHGKAEEEANDAARWRETLMHVGGEIRGGRPRFTLGWLQPAPSARIMQGSIAGHFTDAIDAAKDRRAAAKGAVE